MSLITLWLVEDGNHRRWFPGEDAARLYITDQWDKDGENVPAIKSKVIWDDLECCEILNVYEEELTGFVEIVRGVV